MSLVNIALSGLNANRVALDVTAQNVANINTPGYSRQEALMAAVNGAKHDRLNAGNGVEVTSIRRVTDMFLVKQTWSSASLSSYASGYNDGLSQLENTLKADGFDLSAGFDSLFAALHSATTKPESVSLRQQITSEAEAISRRFNTLNQTLQTQHKDLSDQRNAAVAQANSLMVNIAEVNQKITEANGVGGNPSQLLDTRDKLIGELAEIVEVRTTDQADGSMQVTLTSGQPLVMGGDAGQLKAVPDPSDVYMATMKVEFENQTFVVSGSVGGKIGAINDYQSDVLKSDMKAVDDMATAMADEFNNVLATGQDLNGNAGQPLFAYDPASPAASLTTTGIAPEELAFSSDGNPGNGDVLKDLIAISNKDVSVGSFGSMTLNEGFTAMVGDTAIKARQATSDYQAKTVVNEQAEKARDNVRAVNSDEEAANLMTFSQAHNANMKVISTANKLFDSVLQLF
ncbi:Flagellar hook-associated protein 1 [Vibrio aerogenes CECT 7868]|uniref:Flagellar hook-associated protein 1 n=1 Tax=Vibrio aerogenes CECT 7868 TaxID=1216006 RepID=A0A1M5YKX0_9VIBR|nr:flagellar hook-associated protein FlgK [Vibrio aerogenes]SHI12559.1 Flagellar hook-associated protein 1 [Vibrio aerogenes CECT 7868]